MKWLVGIVFALSFVTNVILWSRIRQERAERHVWRNFAGDGPDDLSGLEQFDPSRYTAAGRRLYPWFLASSLLTVILFCAAVAVFMK